jgi:hypothetical protein
MLTDDFSYWTKLWHPYKSIDSHYNENSFKLVVKNKVRVWNSFDVIELTKPVDWNMDPFNNKTWGLYFNSLNWLYAIFWGYDNDFENHEFMENMVVDYCQYLNNHEVNEMAWFDHATSDRLCFFSALIAHPMYVYFADDNKVFIEKIIFLHISKIREFYDSKFWYDSNHGVFHALAILNICQFEPFVKSDYGLKKFGEIYLQISLKGIISIDDAFTLEQSMYYHQLAIGLLETIPDEMLRIASLDTDIKKLIERMIQSNYWITYDDRVMVPLGDTAFGASVPLAYMPQPKTNEKFKTFPNCGFSIYKYKNKNNLCDHVSFLHQDHRAPHGHFDALSITICHDNIPFLIDSGGPFKYGDPLRFSYFMSNRAHNNLILNNRVHQSSAKDVVFSSPNEIIQTISASHNGYDPIKLTREVFIFDDHGILVIDKLNQITDLNSLQSVWHFAPKCELKQIEDKFIICNEGKEVSFSCSTINQMTHEILSGVKGDDPQGWTTTGIDVAIPINTLVLKNKSEISKKIGYYFSFGNEENFELNGNRFFLNLKDSTFNCDFSDNLKPSTFNFTN